MHVRLIDANAIGRAHHHGQDIRTNGEIQTQAVAGVLNHVRKSLAADPKTLNVMLWDGRAQWRYDLYPAYKNGRNSTPEKRAATAHYEDQRPWIKKGLRFFPVVQLTARDAEADDLAYGLTRQLVAQGHLVSLYTSDMDWLSSVAQRATWVNAKRPSEVVEYASFSRATPYARPSQVPEVKALTGDVSDDVDGLPDVGVKRAASLLAKYGDLDTVLRASEDVMTFSQEAKYFHSLMVPEYQAIVRRNRQLLDPARAPRIEGQDVECLIGDFEELDLRELFYDLHFLQWQDVFSPWQSALEGAALQNSDVLSLRRALGRLAESWAAAGPSSI